MTFKPYCSVLVVRLLSHAIAAGGSGESTLSFVHGTSMLTEHSLPAVYQKDRFALLDLSKLSTFAALKGACHSSSSSVVAK